MSHAVSQFLVSLFLYLCLTTSWANRLSRQVLLGIVLGLAVLVRPQNALFAIVPLFISLLGTELSETVNSSEKLRPSESKHRQGLFKGRGFPVVADLRRTARTLNLRSLIESKQVVAIGVIGIFTFLVQIPQMLVYWWQYGGLLDIPYFQEGTAVGQSASFNWGQPQILNVLFSGFHGLFAWHPLLFLAYAGLALTAQKFPRLALILLIAFFLQVYLISSWWCWWQGTSFGGRMFCNSSFIFVFGLAALWDRFKGESWKRLGAIATIFFMVWNALLVLQYESAMIPPSAPVPMSRIVKNQVRAVPFFVKHVLDR